jgi:hypothetical protein
VGDGWGSCYAGAGARARAFSCMRTRSSVGMRSRAHACARALVRTRELACARVRWRVLWWRRRAGSAGPGSRRPSRGKPSESSSESSSECPSASLSESPSESPPEPLSESPSESSAAPLARGDVSIARRHTLHQRSGLGRAPHGPRPTIPPSRRARVGRAVRHGVRGPVDLTPGPPWRPGLRLQAPFPHSGSLSGRNGPFLASWRRARAGHARHVRARKGARRSGAAATTRTSPDQRVETGAAAG